MNSSLKTGNRPLEVSGVRKSFGGLEVLGGISFEIDSSGFVTFLGPSGCGKTTLFKIILELTEPDEGEIHRNYSSAGYLPQEGLLFPWKTLLENVELPLKLQGKGKEKRRKRVRESLDDFGLSGFEDSYPDKLSGGMRQRAALLRAVLTDAPVLFLDEPFGSLDALTRDKIQRWLLDLLEEINRTILFITHDIEEALFLSEKIIVLSDRPAVKKGEFDVDLAEEERDKTGEKFFEYKRRLLKTIEEVEDNDEDRTVRQLL
ncbi:MAG: ABC transporter ATP-binding protein [Candidatus Acetothermia bacterium]